MWAMVDAQLHDAVRDAPSVRAERAEVERAVRAGELSAVDGTAAHPRCTSLTCANVPPADPRGRADPTVRRTGPQAPLVGILPISCSGSALP